MRILLYSFLVLSLAASCKSADPGPKSDLAVNNLKGKVWKVEKKVHNADEACVCPAAQKDNCNQSTFTYDKNGFLTESTDLDDNGKAVLVSKYAYNRKMACTGIDKFSGEESKGKDKMEIKGNKVIAVKHEDELGKTTGKTIYEYAGELVVSEKRTDQDGKLTGELKNEYNNDQLARQTEFDANGKTITVSTFSRNSHDDVSEYKINVEANGTEYVFNFEYEYDEKGNWIKQTQTYNGMIVTVVYRDITYYEG